MSNFPTGTTNLSSYVFRDFLAGTDLLIREPGGIVLASGYGALNGGTVLGQFTSGGNNGKYGPHASTTLSGGGTLNSTSITVADATNFRVNDNIVVGAATAIAITAISGNTLTLASGGLSAAQANGVTVTVNDGRQKATGVLDNDSDTTNGDVTASMIQVGQFKTTGLVGIGTAKTDLATSLFY